MPDTRIIKTVSELKSFFFHYLSGNPTSVMRKLGLAGVIVDSKIRKDAMLGECQGKMTINGRVRAFKFDNLKGGVYRATIET